MELILWRHAQAEDGEPDLDRALTPRGVKDAARVARWLRARLERGTTRVVCSPAVRTRQTADSLELDYEVSDALAPGAPPRAVLAAIGWPSGTGTLIVVGHNPWIGQLAALLCSGRADPWTMRKGGLWWLVHRPGAGRTDCWVRAVISPELLR